METSYFRIIFLFVLSLIGYQSSWAAHIIGGEITYVCNGGGDYTFTMYIYRDCQGQGANFDSAPGSFTTGTVTIFSQGEVIDVVNLDAPLIDEIEPTLDNNPCVEIPQNVCVQRGRYFFNANLPSTLDTTYTVSYQRCCRNNTINNIFDPGGTGATYTIDLVPAAQAVCNSSPIFNAFPPIVICGNEALNFDHSAFDLDGDQLVYEFCAPFIGGGLAGTGGNGGQGSDPNGVAPDPETPPPYANVNFILPTFTPIQPVVGDPTISIDPNTGIITGVPTINGQYVVGVCVSEFRNGELLSTVKRDFQFNVTTCDPLVQVDLVEDATAGVGQFIVNSCGETEVFFKNQSFDRDNITDFYWEFDLGDENLQITTWDATVDFPDFGTYTGGLFINPGLECGDTAFIEVNVFPPISANFGFDYDTCVVGPVSFSDASMTGAPIISNWLWDFGDGATSETENPKHSYDQPGVKNITLRVRDVNGCEDEYSQSINWSPAPTDVIVQPSSFLGCTPGEVQFNNLTSPIDDSYEILWNFGDGSADTVLSPLHLYDEPGTYSVSLKIVTPFDCVVGKEFPNWITIKEGPKAAFTYSPQEITTINATVEFTDQSELADRWQWEFIGQSASRDQNPTYTFRDTGIQEIILIVTHENGCQDTAFASLDVVPIASYFLPNAFTPNNDTKNDVFIGVGTLSDVKNFEMIIWDKWGEIVFQTEDPFEGWNGKKNNSGKSLPNGVYLSLVNYEDPRGEAIEEKGYVTLIR